MKKPWLYIPIETKVRELHGKILLACFAAIKGFNVILGSKNDINSRSSFLPKGIIFNVGLAKNLGKNSKKYKKFGHKVASIDEEGIVTLNDDLYLRHRVSEDTLNVTDMFFCWGKRQASIIEKKSKQTSCKLYITGNSRFDLLRQEYRVVFSETVQEIREKYGKFFLINTNFGHGNHFAGDDFLIDSLKEKGWMDNSSDKKFFFENIKWQKKMLSEFVTMIPLVAKNFKDYNIIVRPHPSENHNFWNEITRMYPNVLVVYDGNIIPWLIATEALIHNGCTTAVEAFVLGTKVIAYRPFIEEDQETVLPNKISIEAYNSLELIDTLNRIHSISDDRKLKKDYLNRYLDGISGKTASEKISSHLYDNANSVLNNFNYVMFLILEALIQIKRSILKILFNKNISESYLLHKMPDLSKCEIINIIESFSKIDNRIKNIRVKKVGGTCYHIYENG